MNEINALKAFACEIRIAAIAAILILFWIFSPGGMSTSGRSLGIVGNALIMASMIISYFAEEKKKKN